MIISLVLAPYGLPKRNLSVGQCPVYLKQIIIIIIIIEQHTVKNKLKEDLQIMWRKVRLLQMSEWEKLPKLKTNGKLIKLQEEINGVIEELLEEDEMNITNINNLIYAASTIMTQTLNEPSKRSKNRRDVKFWKIRMQKQISSWRNELSIIAEIGTGSDYGKLNRKRGRL